MRVEAALRAATTLLRAEPLAILAPVFDPTSEFRFRRTRASAPALAWSGCHRKFTIIQAKGNASSRP